MTTLLRLGDADREKFGGPEWIEFDARALDDIPFDVQHPWEEQMGISIPMLLLRFAEMRAIGIKGMIWLGRQLAGIEAPGFKAFNIQVRQVRVKKAADADPPGRGSEAQSSETGPSTSS